MISSLWAPSPRGKPDVGVSTPGLPPGRPRRPVRAPVLAPVPTAAATAAPTRPPRDTKHAALASLHHHGATEVTVAPGPTEPYDAVDGASRRQPGSPEPSGTRASWHTAAAATTPSSTRKSHPARTASR